VHPWSKVFEIHHKDVPPRITVKVKAGAKDEEMATRSITPTLRVNQVSAAVVSSAMKVHSILGPGLLESAYDVCLSHELRKRGFHVDTQIGLPVVYE
jgi:hypothetical protein